MMKAKQIYLSIVPIALLAILLACQREIILDNNGYIPKIVMNGIISPDSLIEIRVGRSFLYTDRRDDKSLLKDASLTVFINGEERDKMQMIRIDTISDTDWRGNFTGYKTLYRSSVRPKVGDRVRIEASAEGFNDAWAETSIPVPPQINRVDTSTFFTSKKIVHDGYGEYSNIDYSSIYPENIKVEGQYRNLRIKMAITASPESSQYYQLRVRQMTENLGLEYYPLENYFYIYTDDDPVFDESYENKILEDLILEGIDFEGTKNFTSLLFSNKLFRNNEYTLDFSLTNYYFIHTEYEKIENENENEWGWGVPPSTYIPVHTETLNPPLEVRFTLISPELYPYYRKFNDVTNQDENPLLIISEPEITFSNVHNGIGVVGAVSNVKIQIGIPPFPGGKNMVPRTF
ncbi:DUF4249 family protein [Proteiniphilum sp.]|uniref:DUF4249 family protein n=1 Tax=Proteiniphilum sp. TaxID=1926877 RepID=UPI002B216114|nr:DUF4249 family protein [Proteiniphilum sp.]MEA4916282.1 DUF4249 family protein [Proteiniphilum sp.]